MKNLSPILSLLFLALVMSSCKQSSVPVSDWHHPLYLGHNDFWKERVPVVISNNSDMDLLGDPIEIEVGRGGGKVPIKGDMAESIRLVNENGVQLLYRLNGPDGRQIEKGPIPAGTVLTVPVECKSLDEVTYFIYHDNESAWPVGEYFYTHRQVSNGGFELEGEYGPLDWELDWPEDHRDIKWTDEQSHSGNFCLELSADQAGSGRSYGASQANLHLIPGASYTIEAWVKAQNLAGETGLSLNLSNLERTKQRLRFESFKITLEEGSYDWEKASINFIAPEESDVLSINTFMEGTGVVWIDDLNVICDLDYDIQTEIRTGERTAVTESGSIEEWYGGVSDNPEEWHLRASIVMPNFTEDPMRDLPVYVDIEQLLNRLYADIDENTLMQVTNGVEPIPYLQMGNALLFKQDIPASTFQTFYVYFSKENGEFSESDTYTEISQITENLVQNPGFEEPEASGWERFGESELNEINMDEEEGNKLLQITFGEEMTEYQIPVSDTDGSQTEEEPGTGVFQVHDVEPGSTYFFSARAKSSNILDRTLTLRARFLDDAGEFTGIEEVLQANPDMNTNYEWVQYTMIIQAPTSSGSVQVELLNTVKGEVWYDDVFFMRIGNGSTGAMALERKAARDISELVFWQENPIVKVFQDDLPNQQIDKLSISAARNEVEPLQLALRSPIEYKQLEVNVSPLTDNGGNELENIEVGIVGYVPVSYPSNFIRDFKTRFWQTKIPSGSLGSDGWTGWFPDPVLPFQSLDLPANITTTAWIEIAIPENAAPGDYKGSVSLIHKGEILKEIPLEMQVYDFVLPEASSVATFDLRYNEREMFGRKTTEQEKNEEIWDFMKKHRIAPETIRPEPEFTVEDGEVSIDFTEFDKAGAKYFDELKFHSTYTPWEFYLFGWGRPPSDKFGEKPYHGEHPYSDVDRSKLRPEYIKVYQSALSQYWKHMKEMGWADKVTMYIADEPYADKNMILQTKALCDMIHEVDQEIPIYISTWWYRPEFEGYVDMWGVSHRGGGWGHSVPPEHLAEILKNGGEIIFTTDGMVCTDTPYIGFERLISYFCFKYGATEFENWAANWHTLHPYNYGWHRWHRQSPSEEERYWMRYPNGAGMLIYPGPPIGVDHLVASTKLKILREGVEDYEYMNLLSQLIDKNNSEGKDTGNARKALDKALGLVTIPCADGRYTTGFVADPDAILEIRNEMASAIEDLSR